MNEILIPNNLLQRIVSLIFVEPKDRYNNMFYRNEAKIMQIQQILNDDLLLTLDSVQNKTLIYGEGIGVGMNIGDEVPLQKMTEMQTLSDAPFTSHLISTLSDVPKEYIPVVKVIINDAEEKLDETLNSEIYIRLLDYIYITSLRINHGTMPSNEATYHLNKFYPLEVELAENTIITIRKELSYRFLIMQ